MSVALVVVSPVILVKRSAPDVSEGSGVACSAVVVAPVTFEVRDRSLADFEWPFALHSRADPV